MGSALKKDFFWLGATACIFWACATSAPDLQHTLHDVNKNHHVLHLQAA
jgi:hypothetical protein